MIRKMTHIDKISNNMQIQRTGILICFFCAELVMLFIPLTQSLDIYLY